MAHWFSNVDTAAVERLVAAWGDAPTANEETLGMLLDVARDQVWAYAPQSETDVDADPDILPVPAGDAVPQRLVYAQIQQAKNLWNAGRVDSNGSDGLDGFTFTPRPLDKTIKSIIRPKRAPSVF